MTTLKLATHNVGFRFYSLEYFFECTRKAGISAVELWLGPMHQFIDAYGFDLTETKELLDKYGLKVIALCAETNNPKPTNPANEKLEGQARTKAYFHQVVELAKSLDVPLICVASGWGFKDKSRNAAFKRSAECLQALVSEANEAGIEVALETLQRSESNLVCSLSDLLAMLDQVKGLKACLDLGAADRAGESPKAYVEALGQRLIHCHFVDSDHGETHLSLGSGERDLQKDFDELCVGGFEGYCSLEICSNKTLENPRSELEKSVVTWKKLEENHEKVYSGRPS